VLLFVRRGTRESCGSWTASPIGIIGGRRNSQSQPVIYPVKIKKQVVPKLARRERERETRTATAKQTMAILPTVERERDGAFIKSVEDDDDERPTGWPASSILHRRLLRIVRKRPLDDIGTTYTCWGNYLEDVNSKVPSPIWA
jgi:hypothetical protein